MCTVGYGHLCHTEEPMPPTTRACPDCGNAGIPRLEWHELGDGRPHLAGKCATCGAWLGWLPQKRVWLREAERQKAWSKA